MSGRRAPGLDGRSHIQRIGVVGKPEDAELPVMLDALACFAEKHDLTLLYDAGTLPFVPDGLLLDGEPVDLLLTLGGDGTFLRGARNVAGTNTPVLGLNLGRLGFLTSLAEEELEEGLGQVLAGQYGLDWRHTLEAHVVPANGSDGQRFTALNDVVIHMTGVARVVRLDLRTEDGGNEDTIGQFSGDGVIISTPTGSTAYSLSAGGPIVSPAVECLVVTPICPHSLAFRSLVLPASRAVTVRCLDRTGDLVLTVDGQVGRDLGADDTVVVAQGPVRIPLIRLEGHTFFSTLRRKLNWAVRLGERG